MRMKYIKTIIRPLFANLSYKNWSDKAKNLAWRMHTGESLKDLYEVVLVQRPNLEELKHLIMGFASFL